MLHYLIGPTLSLYARRAAGKKRKGWAGELVERIVEGLR